MKTNKLKSIIKKRSKWKIIILIGLVILLLVSFISYAYQKEIKKQLIELRDWAAKSKYENFKPEENQIWGIDISHHQKGIEWKKFDDALPSFVFLKATEGSTHEDTRYQEYKNKLNAKGIPTGAYHFFSYQSRGISQAKHFLEFANLEKGDLPPVLDAEFTSGMPNKEKVQKELLAFIQYIEKEIGVKPLIYCECDYFKKYLKGEINNTYSLWISDFWRKPSCGYMFWQKTDKFKHPAFKGTIDYNVFNGNAEDLERLLLK